MRATPSPRRRHRLWPSRRPRRHRRSRGARVSPEQLELLGRRVDNSRRLAVVDERLNKVLATLPPDRWFVERHVVFASHPIPFLVLGETGVFALWGMSGLPAWRDVPFFDQLAAKVKNELPGYAGPVRAGVCRTFEPQATPRWWYRAEEGGGIWTMGPDWVIPWLEHFGLEHGLGVKDIERLREMAGPHWARPVTDVPLSAHIPRIG